MKQHRIDDPAEIDATSIAAHVSAGSRVIVQYSKPGYCTQHLESLNALARIHKRNLEIRFYGHYSSGFDASVLRSIPDVQSLSVDCLMSASNLNALSCIHELKELSLGVYDLDDKNILTKCDLGSVEDLALGSTRSGSIDLSVLAGCKKLARLHTSGHTKNITTVCTLHGLKNLTLSQIKRKDDVAFVSDMPQLLSLRILLGGRTSFTHIAPANLESLEIIRVQGLEDVGDLGRFEKLESVRIEDQIKLRCITFGRNPRLRDVRIINCKTLEQITGVSALKSLVHMRLYGTAIPYESFISNGVPASLKTLAFYTTKSKRDAEIRADLASRGFREFSEPSGCAQGN